MTERIWTAGLVIIGDEILSGRTQDRNIAQIALWLNLQGIRLAEVRVVGDTVPAIVEAVNADRPAGTKPMLVIPVGQAMVKLFDARTAAELESFTAPVAPAVGLFPAFRRGG